MAPTPSAALIRIYRERLEPEVERFYGRLSQNPVRSATGRDDKVGLLTFPNSGTTWTLALVERATGVRRHTVYERERAAAGGVPSRGVFALACKGARLPKPHEPVLVKDHVNKHGNYSPDDVRAEDLESVFQRWSRHLAEDYARHVRLVRNPLDNLRARFRYHQEHHRHKPEFGDPPFREYLRVDLKRYLVWHACCDRVARTRPLLTIAYEALLESPAATLGELLAFCGLEVAADRVELAAKDLPPQYGRQEGLPNHLGYFTVEDVEWVAEQLRQWSVTCAAP